MATAEQENEAYMLAERLKEEQIVRSSEAAWLREETEQIAQGVEVARLREPEEAAHEKGQADVTEQEVGAGHTPPERAGQVQLAHDITMAVQFQEQEDAHAKGRAEVTGQQAEAASTLPERVGQEQLVHDIVAVQLREEGRVHQEEVTQARAPGEADMTQEDPQGGIAGSASTLPERVGQEQLAHEIVAVQLREEEGRVCQEKEEVAQARAPAEADMMQENPQGGIAGPATKSSKAKKSNKRPRVVISSESDDADGDGSKGASAGKVEEGDGENLSEAELIKRERE